MRAHLLILTVTAACTYYPDTCNRAALQELRTVDRLIEETRENLARGYAYVMEEYGYGTGFVLCTGGYPMNFCTGGNSGYRRRAVAIDPEVERRKLEALRVRREKLIPATAGCTAARAFSAPVPPPGRPGYGPRRPSGSGRS